MPPTNALPVTTVTSDGVAVVDLPRDGLQNGSPDGMALVDAAGDLVELLAYEGTFRAVGGPAAGVTSTAVPTSESGSTPAGWSLSRLYDPAADETFWDLPAPATKGQVNPVAAPVPDLCATGTPVTVGAVQGAGSSTPRSGQVVDVKGVVVAVLPGFGGFHVQDAGDSNAATSDGVFVAGAEPVDLGDTVAVRGIAGENFGQTEVTPGATCRCAPRAPRRTCRRPPRWTSRPVTPPASGSRACSSPRSTR